jgi:K+-sensing histidine kinase KdpD
MLQTYSHSLRREAAHCLAGTIALASVTVVCFRLRLNLATTTCLYLTITVLLSLRGCFLASIVVSLIGVGCLAYYFAPPIFSFRVDDPFNLAAIIAFFTVSALAAVVTNANACLRWLAGDTPNLREARAAATRIVQDGTRAAGIISRMIACNCNRS